MLRKWRMLPAVLAAVLAAFGVTQIAKAAVYSISFFSQRDTAWSANTLGTTTDTIATQGCAVTATAMALKYRGANLDPGKLNAYLTKNGGIAGGVLDWASAAKYDGTQWLKYQGKGSIPDLKSLSRDLDSGKLIIAESKRFGSQTHFVMLRGVTPDGTQGYYWDPYDTTATQRRIGDGWVNVGAGTRVFTKP